MAREIRDITVISNIGAVTYKIGEKINGIEIVKIINNSYDTERDFHAGYVCLSDACFAVKNIVVEIWNAPVIVEYYEKEG